MNYCTRTLFYLTTIAVTPSRYTAVCVWAVGWVAYVNAKNKRTGSGKRYLSDKIMTLYLA